jgi:hypothetical protein
MSRGYNKLTGRKIISFAQYVKNKEERTYTTFRILPTGECGYMIGDTFIKDEDFKKSYPLPGSLIMNNTQTLDGTKSWLTS